MAFTHFHVHSQYSILDGAASVPGLVEKAIADGMKAISLTDHGNMFGIKLFYDTCPVSYTHLTLPTTELV